MNDVDRADHPDAAPYSFSQYHSVHSKKLMPEDMDFALIGREVEDLIRQLERLSAQMIDCLEHFDPSLHQRPLTVLIGNLVDQCERQREEMHVDSQRITQMLNEVS
ncbi:uncharacterized protein LOC101846304 [Aplysia californica]|uniref:Uncharacterized protein LOC101846304 n=1 Tax=Aplysia californica TaxID=6500 RepID=A0ABM0K2S4_APLCA|nr:uncharacterized protein LOC101846304 [Aplysia californica]